MPWRLKYHFNIYILHRGQRGELALYVRPEHVRHPAAGGSHGHFDFDLIAITGGRDLAIVNEAKVNNIDRNFGIVHRAQPVPDQSITKFGRDLSLRFLCADAKDVSIFGIKPEHVSLVRHHRVAAAERLREPHLGTCRNRMRDPAGNLRCDRITCRSCCIAQFQLLLPYWVAMPSASTPTLLKLPALPRSKRPSWRAMPESRTSPAVGIRRRPRIPPAYPMHQGLHPFR